VPFFKYIAGQNVFQVKGANSKACIYMLSHISFHN